jgi:ribosomal protein L31E
MDRGTDYVEIKNLLIKSLNEYFEQDINIITDNIHKPIYLIISLISLRNGSRISESVKAFKLFMLNPNADKVNVKISKRKDGKTRLMFFPNNVENDMLKIIDKINHKIIYKNNKKLSSCVRVFLGKYYNTNTHSLRYAFINYLLYTNNLPAEVVSRIVGHKSLNTLNNYIRDTKANHELEMFNF